MAVAHENAADRVLVLDLDKGFNQCEFKTAGTQLNPGLTETRSSFRQSCAL